MKIGRWPFHPLLFAIFPILSIYQVNQAFVRADQLVRPLLFATVAASLSWLVLAAATRRPRRAGLTISLGVALFYGWDALLRFSAPRTAKALTWLTGFWRVYHYDVRPRDMVPVAVLVIAALLLLIWLLKQPKLLPIDMSLNIMGLVLVLQPIVQIVPFELIRHHTESLPAPPLFTSTKTEARPHILYVILDGYARADVLREFFEFDNEPFLAELESRGFYVARRSRSNYIQTALSLASSLNARYLDELVSTHNSDREPLRQRIASNSVLATLRGLGYRFVGFDSGYEQTDISEAADAFWTPQANRTNEFEEALWYNSPLGRFHLPGAPEINPFDLDRARVRLVFDTLPRLARDWRPTFAFAHVILPHPPFLFTAAGAQYEEGGAKYSMVEGTHFNLEIGDDTVYAAGYLEQVRYLNNRLLELIDTILAGSSEPPVLILQSDHGSGMMYDLDSLEETNLHERFGNFTAIRWADPAFSSPELTDDLTPVNLFRVVFNGLFDAELPLLPARCFYSTWDNPFDFVDVTEQVRVFDAQ